MNFMKNETTRDYLIPTLGDCILNLGIPSHDVRSGFIAELIVDLYIRKHLQD